MDPLSATLSVLALATALKDIIEVANNIQDAFSKLPSNYAKAQKLMEEIQEILQAMRATYKGDFEKLDKDGGLCKSLNNLKKEMMDVYTKCAILIPPVKLKRKDKFKVAVYSFWNRDKVEELISDLKDRVDKAFRLFFVRILECLLLIPELKRSSFVKSQALSQMRIEDTVNRIDTALQQPVSAPNLSITQAHQRVDIHAMVNVSDARLFSFAETSSMTMTWIPETIPLQDLSRAFLRRELNILEKSVRALSTRWFENVPADLEVSPVNVSWFLGQGAASGASVHREALALTHEIRDLTEYSPPPAWVHSADIGLSHLSVCLSGLQMLEETVAISNLRVDLWTAMDAVLPGSNTSGRLVDALTNLSISLSNMGEGEQSNLISDQALALIESMPDISGLKEIQAFQIARNLSVGSRNIAESDRALELAGTSVRHMEDVLGLDNAVPQIMPADSPLEGKHEDEHENAVIETPTMDFSHDSLFTYASMIVRLSETQLNNGLLVESSSSAKNALAVLHHLASFYPGSYRIWGLLSRVFVILSLPNLCMFNTDSENWEYAEEHVNIMTEVGKIDPQRYVLPLMSALYTKRCVLLRAGKEKRALQVHKQMLDIGSMAVVTHENTRIPSEIEGDYYAVLADYHFSCGRFQDAVYAAKNATTQFFALESMIPDYSPIKYFRVALMLCKNHFILKQHDACISEGFKALQVLEKTSTRWHRAILIDEHMELLDKMMEALEETHDARALAWARDVNSRIENLFKWALSLGHQIKLLNAQAPNKYVAILQKNDYIEEAAQYLEGALKRWKDTYGEGMSNTMLGISHLQCLMALPNLFQTKGEIDEGLKYSQQAMDVAEGLFTQGLTMMKTVVYNNIASTHIYLLLDAGRYVEALELSENAVAFARENEAAGTSSSPTVLIQALGGRTLCQLYSLQPQAAIASASEGVDLSQKLLERELAQTDTKSNRLTMLYVSFLGLADGMADAGDVNQALLFLDKAKEALMKKEVARGEEPGSDVHSHQVIDTKRARFAFALGDYTTAANLMEEVVEVERERAKPRKALVSSLIRALQFAGISYCTLGRHDDGMRTAAEVRELKRSLDPSSGLARMIQIEEKRMTSRALWKSVQDAKEKLKCDHQESTFVWL